jgi:hypothetical protein
LLENMTGARELHPPWSPGFTGSRRLRAWVTLWFAFYVHYVPFHLAIEDHQGGWTEATSKPAVLPYPELVKSCGTESDHLPHCAADHLFRLAARSASDMAVAFLAVVAVETSVPPPRCQTGTAIFLIERQHPPAPVPPGPCRPRAPPMA